MNNPFQMKGATEIIAPFDMYKQLRDSALTRMREYVVLEDKYRRISGDEHCLASDRKAYALVADACNQLAREKAKVFAEMESSLDLANAFMYGGDKA